MSASKYAVRLNCRPDETSREAEARITAEIMGGEVAFGSKPILLYAADLAFLARVKAALKAKEKSV